MANVTAANVATNLAPAVDPLMLIQPAKAAQIAKAATFQP